MSDTHVRTIEVETARGQCTEVLVPQKSLGEEAVVVWDAALVLAHFLQKHQQSLFKVSANIEESGDSGVNVIELGAGTGAVGLVAAALG